MIFSGNVILVSVGITLLITPFLRLDLVEKTKAVQIKSLDLEHFLSLSFVASSSKSLEQYCISHETLTLDQIFEQHLIQHSSSLLVETKKACLLR
jgi:hypothetical protein